MPSQPLNINLRGACSVNQAINRANFILAEYGFLRTISQDRPQNVTSLIYSQNGANVIISHRTSEDLVLVSQDPICPRRYHRADLQVAFSNNMPEELSKSISDDLALLACVQR